MGISIRSRDPFIILPLSFIVQEVLFHQLRKDDVDPWPCDIVECMFDLSADNDMLYNSMTKFLVLKATV